MQRGAGNTVVAPTELTLGKKKNKPNLNLTFLSKLFITLLLITYYSVYYKNKVMCVGFLDCLTCLQSFWNCQTPVNTAKKLPDASTSVSSISGCF